MKTILDQIEFLRQQMHYTASIYGMRHPKVLEASCRLDEAINEYYRAQKKQDKLSLVS